MKDKEQLGVLLRQSHIFALPSFHETFGLVYVEVLSHGLPILYSEGAGVDGFFGASYGRSCNPHSTASIIATIRQMMDSYETFSIDESYIRQHFNRDKIADIYLSLYTNHLAKHLKS